ncbi:MAG: hypothetical protein GW748_07530 [Alphaproteobacteria bacterium]|nr:hypothetical protein [Alphaproteobacteria bacterium]NCQ67578.1 hypothetical protein [Alphaproteobacteria bacterium]NCT08350.1 hypothetical protein [Alphaproteobacteria bacterium]
MKIIKEKYYSILLSVLLIGATTASASDHSDTEMSEVSSLGKRKAPESVAAARTSSDDLSEKRGRQSDLIEALPSLAILWEKGNGFLRAKEYESAAQLYEHVYEYVSTQGSLDTSGLAILGYAQAKAGNSLRAREIIQLLLETTTAPSLVALKHAAGLYHHIGDYENSALYCDKVLETALFPLSADYGNAGLSHCLNGNYAYAAKLFDLAFQENAKPPKELLKAAAISHYNLGNSWRVADLRKMFDKVK